MSARAGSATAARGSGRNRELVALIPVALLLTIGFAAVFAQNDSQLSDLSLSYGLYFLAVCLATHIFIRIRLPNADPYLFPLMALLTAIGLVMIYRLDSELAKSLARDQANWFVIGLVLFAVVVQMLRDYTVLERYRYTIAVTGIILLLAPRLPLIGAQVNGAYLGIKIGPLAFQPAELAKICIVVFLASYLREHRELLVVGARRILGVTLPPLKHLGPLLVVWGAAMLMLIVIRDLGSSLMFFAAFLALIYVATGRLSFVVIGMVMFLVGAWVIYNTVPHVTDRVDIWLDPYQDPGDAGYQVLQSMFAQADGGLFGKGFAESMVVIPGGNDPLLPAAQTDLIYTLIVSELGLFGGSAIIVTYLLIAARGFKVALMANDGFSKLLATGLTSVFAFQAFVIIGGVTRVIPLTGVTLPLVSYGGSSILANFILLALLLLVSDRARREARQGRDAERTGVWS
ncbi:MAG: FtsW/RodA/SpoVE family cell cycle protein [Solirubrobacterales bacterium]|nr:FtsW/RodA/SpoVE family cell cycle protein [Solirubrobacterales bacterium]